MEKQIALVSRLSFIKITIIKTFKKIAKCWEGSIVVARIKIRRIFRLYNGFVRTMGRKNQIFHSYIFVISTYIFNCHLNDMSIAYIIVLCPLAWLYN